MCKERKKRREEEDKMGHRKKKEKSFLDGFNHLNTAALPADEDGSRKTTISMKNPKRGREGSFPETKSEEDES